MPSNLSPLPFCEACVYGKHHVSAYPKGGGTRAIEVLQLVHADLCGPVSIDSYGGGKYFLTFIDDFSRYSHVYILKQKSDAFECFQDFKAKVECQTGHKLQCLRTDNGGEFVSNSFNDYCRSLGISRQFTVPYSSAQNGVAERRNRSTQNITRSLLK